MAERWLSCPFSDMSSIPHAEDLPHSMLRYSAYSSVQICAIIDYEDLYPVETVFLQGEFI